MLYLNIFNGNKEHPRNFPHNYRDYYPNDEEIDYIIYKNSGSYFIHNPEAPYAIECNVGRNGDIFFPVLKDDNYVTLNDDKEWLNDLPHITVKAVNNRPSAIEGDTNPQFVITSDIKKQLTPKIELVDTMINFLNDKIKIFKLQIAKKGIQFSIIESNGKGVELVDISEIEDEEQIDEATTDTDQKNKKQKKKQEVAYTSYKLFLEDTPSEADHEKMTKWEKSQNRFPLSIYDTKNLRSNGYIIKFDRYDEKDNAIIIKRYKSKENEYKNRQEIDSIKDGYITESIDIDLILHHRQNTNTKQFRDSNFSLKKHFLNPETIADIINPTNLEWNNPLLKDDQKRAVLTALGNSPIVAVNGPPGTGKTTVITEMVYQFALQGKSIWVSSQTNLAIDNVLERLPKDERIRPERKGRQERVKDKLFNSDVALAHYFERQHLDKLVDFVEQHKKSTDVFETYRQTHDDIIKINDKINRLSQEINQARNIADAPQICLFLKWIEDTEFMPYGLNKNILQKQCVALDKVCPFLGDTDEYLWKASLENIIKELTPKVENLYTTIRNDSETREKFEQYINDLKQQYPETVKSNSKETVADKNEKIKELEANKDKMLKKLKLTSEEALRELVEQSTPSKKDMDKYEFHQKLLKLPRVDKQNEELFKNTYTGICEYTPNLIGATCNISPKQLFLSDDNNSKKLPMGEFDVVIVDEVSKFTTVEMFVLAMFGKKLILIGDHHQLPPVFKEGRELQRLEDVMEELEYNEEEIEDFNEKFKEYEKHLTHSHFESIWKSITPAAKIALTTQFRCHPDIMNVFNLFYQNDPEINGLTCGISPDQRKHTFTPSWNPKSKNVVWLDSSSRDKLEDKPENSTSTCNKYEVDIIMQALDDIYQQAKEQQVKKEVGVISLYGAQVGELKERFKRLNNQYTDWLDIEINTVDDFQGKEKDIVFVSMVRNPRNLNSLKRNPFIREYRRINVAMSRAKELLVIIGSCEVYRDIDVLIDEKPVYVYKAILENNRQNIALEDGKNILKHRPQIIKIVSNNNNKHRGGKR